MKHETPMDIVVFGIAEDNGDKAKETIDHLFRHCRKMSLMTGKTSCRIVNEIYSQSTRQRQGLENETTSYLCAVSTAIVFVFLLKSHP